MANAKHPDRKPSNVDRWKAGESYDLRAKARNWLRFLKRNTAVVTIDELGTLEKTGFVFTHKGRVSGARSRIKAAGVQAVVQAIRMKEDVQKTVHAIRNNDWTSVSRLVQPLGLPVDYTPKKKQQQRKVLANV